MPQQASTYSPRSRWMTYVLLAAGVYNILWAIQAICWPSWLFLWSGAAPLAYPEIWQSFGIFLGAWGLGCLVAASNPIRHWPVVLVGLVGRVLESVLWVGFARGDQLPWSLCSILAVNDIIWWVPLGGVLWCAYKAHEDQERHASPEIQRLALRARTNKGETLLEMSMEKPLLIVFLRTTDCPFCRESLAHLAAARAYLQRQDVELVLVNMKEDQEMHEFLHSYGLSDVPRVSDRQLHLYRAFGLKRGSLWSVVGPPVWVRGLVRIVQYGAGRLTPDLLQMPGLFMVFHGQVLWNFVHQSIADQPKYEDIPIPS